MIPTLPSLLLVGCVINGDKYPRPRDLAPAWLVDRTRILAVAAEPPEAHPGEVVTFSALIGAPPRDRSVPNVVWVACPFDESFGAGCAADLSGLDLEDPDPDALAALGLIGFEPLLPPVYVVPADLLAPLSPEERQEGTYVMIQTTVVPPEVLEDPEAELDPAALEASFKRLVVSEATTPNHNPVFDGFTVEGLPVPEGALVHLDPLQLYEIGVVLGDGSIENYTFVTSDGESDTRTEEPYVGWFATSGEIRQEVTLYPYLEAEFVTPAKRGTEGTWYAVMRDRRGGMAWWSQAWVVD